MRSLAARVGLAVGLAAFAVGATWTWAAAPSAPAGSAGLWLVAGATLVGLVGWATLRVGLRPLAGMATRLAAVDEESLERRIPVRDLPSELRDVAHQANALFDRLDAAFERERRTTSNIAHELRTPIAELRGLTEVALRVGDDPEFVSRAMAETYAIAVEMDRIATTLLRVARAQAGQLEVRRVELRADEQLRTAVGSVSEVAQRRRIEFTFGELAPATIRADPDLLDLILVNLLTNAAQHAPAGDRVRCAVRVRGRGVEFVIENTNVGLTPEDMPHLTETFWKKEDVARHDPVHTGLGLALVEQLAQTCGFRVTLSLVEDRVRALVRVPATPAG